MLQGRVSWQHPREPRATFLLPPKVRGPELYCAVPPPEQRLPYSTPSTGKARLASQCAFISGRRHCASPIRYLLIRNTGQSEGTDATTLPVSHGQSISGIHGIGHNAIAFPQKGFRGIHGLGNVAIAFPLYGTYRGQAGLQYRLRVSPLKAPPPERSRGSSRVKWPKSPRVSAGARN